MENVRCRRAEVLDEGKLLELEFDGEDGHHVMRLEAGHWFNAWIFLHSGLHIAREANRLVADMDRIKKEFEERFETKITQNTELEKKAGE